MNTKSFFCYVFGLISVLSTGSAQAISLGFFPVSQTFILGQPAQVALKITDLEANTAPSLGTFDLNIDFNPTLLSFKSITFGDPILGNQLNLDGLGSLSGVTLKTSSTLNIFEVSGDSENSLNYLQADSFIVATLTLNTLGLGTTALTFSNVILGDAFGVELTPNLDNGLVTVTSQSPTPIPESSSPSIVLFSLLCLRSLSRKTKNSGVAD